MAENKKTRISIRVDPELHEAIEEARWKARMSQNEYLVRLIMDALGQPRPENKRRGRPRKKDAEGGLT